MRKLYSLVLMATALLIGTNAWADVHPGQQPGDEAKISKDGGLTWQYARYLKEAFDAVEAGVTAKIELLTPVNLTSPINMPAAIPVYESGEKAGKGRLHEVAGQNITLNLAGKNITADDNVTAFRIMKGALNIDGNGTISKSGSGSSVWKGGAVITIFGAEDSLYVDWSKLTIGKGVTIQMTPDVKNGVGIMIQDHNQSNDLDSTDPFKTSAGNYAAFVDKFGYGTWDNVSKGSIYNFKCGATAAPNNWQQGSAFGVKVFVDGKVQGGKYGIQITGHVNQKPECMGDSSKRHPELYPAPYYKYQYPYVKVSSTGSVASSAVNGSVGIYASGYGVFDINGQVEGATGLYMKASDADVTDAYIRSTSHTPNTSGGGASGVKDAGGSAIVLESNDAYAGGSGLSITGDTRVEGDGGYAIFEETYKDDESSTTSHISIEGGTIQGGGEGAIAITVGTQDATKVTGGNITAQNNTSTVTVGKGTPQEETIEVSNLFPNNQSYHTTEVEVDGKTVIVVSQGEAPATDPLQATTSWSWCVEEEQSGKNVAWTRLEDDEIPQNTTITLGELQIVSGTGESLGERQQLTIKSGATLQVNHLILNDYARIIVEAGGKLIVKGTQGIVAPKTENIILQHNSNTNQFATFLFNPSVESNKHPNAIVQFTTNSWWADNSNLQWEWFGIPTYNKAKSITSKAGDDAIYATVEVFENNDWTDLGYIGGTYDNNPAVLAKLNQPFAAYNLLAYRAYGATAPEITISGELVGNVNAPLNANKRWNPFANSYTAEVDAQAFVSALSSSENIADAIYVAIQNNNGTIRWDVKADDQLTGLKLKPMQAFLLNNPRYVEETAIDYESMVYGPATSNAPRRFATADNSAKVTINVANENGTLDDVDLRENENAKSYEKYLNSDINIYVVDGEKNDYIVAEDLENTYVGFSTVKGGEFTISFANVEGREFDMIDLETGAKVAVNEGETYSFVAAANTVADYRFKLVERAKLPTAIENTEAVKSVKGIYTITGQYLGEMNVWNALPAGVYVVNGEKLVK